MSPASHRPFTALGLELRGPGEVLRQAIRAAARHDEALCVQALIHDATWPPALAQATQALALELATRLRTRTGHGLEGLVQALLQAFSLSTQEGIALMCMAEALLRIPDEATRDALIRDKVADANWAAHLGQSPSLFVNAATWGLVLTGKLVATHEEHGLRAALHRVAAKGGEPLIRKAVDLAMRLLGEQFVIGQHIHKALARARVREAQGFRHSYDMLGEAALTDEDALRYTQAYEHAIHAIGQAKGGRPLHHAPGISIKLSALHPRYVRSQHERVMRELYPRLLQLAALARHQGIGLNIDAEEADRLDLSLDLFTHLCLEPSLQGWDGLGFVLQAYQKRCPQVLDYLIDLARRSGHRLMLRLVKGAYWDSEIKRAQVEGHSGYPVYTRKAHTDLAYLACARRMLAAPAEVYPQFATHNAHTVAAIHTLAGPQDAEGRFEFQCLHGMGEPLYEMVSAPPAQGGLGRPCRIYAPVGTHDTLLAYLVRRLLENGANSSFVHRMADTSVAVGDLVACPVAQVRAQASHGAPLGAPHPAIALPVLATVPGRPAAAGLDWADEPSLASLHQALSAAAQQAWHAAPMLAEPSPRTTQARSALPVCNPADQQDVVGTVVHASLDELAQAAQASADFAPAWQRTPAATRAAMLAHAAQLMVQHQASLMALLVREAGKTLPSAQGEVREAIDFLRHHASQALAIADLPTQPLGPVLCISPWNFPLAIFTGQLSAALAAGNTVLAKPAEQTPLVAALAVALLHEAGVPRAALQLLPGPGHTVGAALAAHPAIRGLMFTGSTEVARLLQTSLAGRLNERGQALPLVAETGGQNAMIVDSSALPEQVVQDALHSAFDSAGQRCSALRVLCVQDDVADTIIPMLRGALQQWCIAPGDRLQADAGPLIDQAARARVQAHIQAMADLGCRIDQAPSALAAMQALPDGCFLAPTLIELPRLSLLQHEVFGPVLHILRFARQDLGTLMAHIHATGYGLTMGIHSRIDDTIHFITQRARVGNLYVNRSMIGAVVGVQPFGGEGLSGTGPQSGGALYLPRLLQADAASAQATLRLHERAGTPWPPGASGVHPGPTGHHSPSGPASTLAALRAWLALHPRPRRPALLHHIDTLASTLLSSAPRQLGGPTGERNTSTLRPLPQVLCLADDEGDLIYQLATVLAAGSRAVWVHHAARQPLITSLPAAVRAHITQIDQLDAPHAEGQWDAALVHGKPAELAQACRTLHALQARRSGPLISVQTAPQGWCQAGAFHVAALLREQTCSVNTAAAGGNAQLLSLA